MSTTAIGAAGASTGAGAAAAATTAGTGASGTATTFQQALASTVQDARSLTTSSLGSMVAASLDQSHVIAVSRPVVATSSTATTQSVSGSSRAGGKGTVKVPEALQTYGNGKIPADALEQIGIKKHKLWTVAAEAFKQMRGAAADAGVDIGVTDSYRPYEEQVDLVRRKGLYSQGGLAAVPGTSPHGWGMALDVDVTPAGLEWMRAHAAEYGYVEAVPREPWHWEYHGNK
jgi:hypothetical protein